MGNISSGPVTAKDSGSGQCKALGIAWGYSSMQGWRERMEDAHLALPSLGQAGSTSSSAWNETALFGVMDGHGGEHVAQYCRKHLPKEICRQAAQDMGVAMTNAFHRMDELLADPQNLRELQSLGTEMMSLKSFYVHPNSVGCTAVLCCLRRHSIVVANAGDSRAVLCRNGKAIDMSEDHKPNLPTELARIERAGGCILEQRFGGHTQYRVNGNLNLSRSIGDLSYKQNGRLAAEEQMICSTPDIRHFWRQAGDEFIVMACDGVWDVLSSQEVVNFVRQRLRGANCLDERIQDGSLNLAAIAEELLDTCISPDLNATFGVGGDNMTVVIIVFSPDVSPQVGSSVQHSISPSWLCPIGPLLGRHTSR